MFEKLLKLIETLNVSPIVWAVVGIALILIAKVVPEDNKVVTDMFLLLAGAVITRIRSAKPTGK